jgi:sialate O-acetylesterase
MSEFSQPTRESAQRGIFVKTATVLLSMAAAGASLADVKLPAVFSDNMVLQRGQPVPIWGWADAGEKVTVSFGGQSKEATADEDGEWSVRLGALEASAEPASLKVTGNNAIALNNVLVGEVWIGSGQSNMQMSVRDSSDAKKEETAANHPNIRLFQIPVKHSTTAQSDVEAKWDLCTPERIPSFSAVLYFFGRELHGELDVPIGLIESAWGGTRVEPWTPLNGFAQVPAIRDIYDAASSRIPGTTQYAEVTDAYVTALGEWLPKAREQLKKNEAISEVPSPPNPLPRGHQTPITIYNSMIHPIIPFGIKGAIWYQGESNNGEGMLYYEKKKALIGGWRELWAQGDFPFYFAQIAPYNYDDQRAGQLPELWEGQEACLQITNTGMAVLTDIANIKDIHPKNKQDVGKRLALWALAKDYGKDVVYSGPLYRDHQLEGGKIVVRFAHASGGLASRDGKELSHFEIAAADGKFVPAKAAVRGGSVIISSADVSEPTQARFAWSQLAEPNLINKAGLPASPFRTHRPEK